MNNTRKRFHNKIMNLMNSTKFMRTKQTTKKKRQNVYSLISLIKKKKKKNYSYFLKAILHFYVTFLTPFFIRVFKIKTKSFRNFT